MLTYIVAFLLSAITAFVLTPFVRRVALSRGYVDVPEEARKVHRAPVPRIGGIAIAVAFFVPVVGLVFVDNKISVAYLEDPGRIAGLVVGSLIVVALGLVDDVGGLSARQKFAVQLVVAALAWVAGYRIGMIGNPFGDPISLGWLSVPVTMLWIVGIMNAFNLIDGLDGLATGIALFSVLTLFVLGVTKPNVIVGLTAIALAGSLVGFLRYNFNPASIFMGDSGSLFLGWVLAVNAISGSAKSSTVVSLLIPLLAFGLPVMDTLFAVVRRFVAGRPIFGADREHMHHKLLDLGLSQRQVVLVMYGACAVLAGGALALQYANSVQAAAILGAFGVAAFGVSQSFGYLTFREVKPKVQYGLLRSHRVRQHLDALEEAGRSIRAAATVDEAIEIVLELSRQVGADGVVLKVAVMRGDQVRRYQARWPDVPTRAPGPVIHLEHALDWSFGPVQTTGAVSFHWHCEDRHLQIPEASGYDWIALVFRDRVLELAGGGDVIPYRPRLVDDV